MPAEFLAFGDLRVVQDNGETRHVRGRQASALAVLLAAHPDGVTRDRLIDQIWGEDLPAEPEAALHSVISRLRTVIGHSVSTTPTGYRVRAPKVDTSDYEAAVAQARSQASLEAMEAADLLWTGDPYRGLDDIPDARAETERLRLVRKWATRDRLELMMESGKAAAAADELANIVADDPLDEESLALLMRALYRSGRKPEALRAFRRYEERLIEETGLDPSAHIRELEVAILTDHVEQTTSESRPLTPLELEITYITTREGGKIAVGRSGSGDALVVHPGWISKLDLLSTGLDMRAPFWAELAEHFEILIFDRAGTGLSRDARASLTLDDSVSELIEVMRESFDQPVPLLAGSAAGPIAVKAAIAEPSLFSHLIFKGTYASGPETFRADVASSVVELVRTGWGMGSDLIANLLFPSASTEIRDSWARTHREFADPETAASLMRQMYSADVSDLLESVRTPSLVMHYNDDRAIPSSGGEQLAQGIPGARYVALEGRTHYPLPGDEPGVASLIAEFVADT